MAGFVGYAMAQLREKHLGDPERGATARPVDHGCDAIQESVAVTRVVLEEREMAAGIKKSAKFLHDHCIALRRKRRGHRFAGFGQTIGGLAVLRPDQNRGEFAGIPDRSVDIRRKLHAVPHGNTQPHLQHHFKTRIQRVRAKSSTQEAPLLLSGPWPTCRQPAAQTVVPT